MKRLHLLEEQRILLVFRSMPMSDFVWPSNLSRSRSIGLWLQNVRRRSDGRRCEPRHGSRCRIIPLSHLVNFIHASDTILWRAIRASQRLFPSAGANCHLQQMNVDIRDRYLVIDGNAEVRECVLIDGLIRTRGADSDTFVEV